ncbi:MAG: site-specific DNA-methyltransferase [Cellvibrionales bacterium]|nr:site-specific DNA-methyltransferase [Cellvibrionales bacterium]
MDCIFIDPPYNTGNEGWCYNDNLNAPMIREWLMSNPIGIEDGLRHDKWCAMMWPRLRLLYELLAEDGVLFICIDNNEFDRLKILATDVFGDENYLGTFVWQTKRAARGVPPTKMLMDTHEYIHCFAKGEFKFKGMERDEEDFSNHDNDPRGLSRNESIRATGKQNNYFTIVNPENGMGFYGNWAFSEKRINEMIKESLIIFPPDESGTPRQRKFFDSYRNETKALITTLGWFSTENATNNLMDIFGGKKAFDFPKPISLVQFLIEQATPSNGLIMDSFAGSGTTAHAVLQANKADGGNRRFILVEMEEYADKLTAERVRRVIDGYSFKGTQKTELLRDKMTWSKIKNAEKLTAAVAAIENLHGHEYDSIKKTVKDGELIVTGEKTVKEKTAGLGGGFTYCTLGKVVDLDKILNGGELPDFEELGSALFHRATARAFDSDAMREADFYLGSAVGQHVWLLYRPDMNWLRSPAAALTLERAESFVATAPESRHTVFAPARHVSQRTLFAKRMPVDFVPLPFSLYQLERS